jgi:release factor glutamine methyltransferase
LAGLAPDVRDHDPLIALDGGADGLDAHRGVIAAAARVLVPGGALVLEIGAGQVEAVLGLVRQIGWLPVGPDGLRNDLAGRPRAVIARKG